VASRGTLIVIIYTPSSHLPRDLIELKPHVRRNAGASLSNICPVKLMLSVSAG
jgi:hypothetical protein